MSLLYFWIAVAIIFLIIEFLTVTFYGLALSLSAGIVVLYVAFTGELEFSLTQAFIFATMSAVFAYFLPKWLSSKDPDVPQWADRYLGERRTIKKMSGDYKISLDGVDYMAYADEDIVVGDRVEVIWHKGAGMKVKKV